MSLSSALLAQITELTFSEALTNAIFMMLIVFIVLIVLWGLVALISRGAKLFAREPVAVTAPAVPAAHPAAGVTTAPAMAQPGTIFAGNIKLTEVDERSAAMIMAIVSDESGIPLSELRFKSIKKLS